MINRLLTFEIGLIITCLAAACSSRSIHEPVRPSTDPVENPQLRDPSMRISGAPITLNYDDGGVLFSRTADGTISGVRVSDGVGFDYNPTTKLLTINGVPIAISSAQLAATDGTTEWHELTLADQKTVIYIVVNL